MIGVLITPTQTNISSVGSLNSLQVSGVSTFSDIYSSGIATLSSLYSNSLSMNPIRIGSNAGVSNQSQNSIAIGLNAGAVSQEVNCIAIGTSAGQTNQGSGSIAIGFNAGSNQASNSLVLNASGTVVTGATGSSTYIAPIRNITQTNVIGYNTTTSEVTYFVSSSSTTTPILTRIQSATQNILNNTDTTILFDSLPSYGNQGTTGISYNASTGNFINLSGATNLFIVTAGVTWSSNSTGNRGLWLGFGASYSDTYARTIILSVTSNAAQQIVISLLLAPNEQFGIRCNQSSGSTLTFVTGGLAGCGITITRIS